jgi:hypothetical protein
VTGSQRVPGSASVAAKAVMVLVSTVTVLAAVEIGLRLHAGATDPARTGVDAALEESRRGDLPSDPETAGLLGLVRPSSNPSVIYELKPGLDGSFLGCPVRTNRFGMRGPEIERKKPPGTRRVMGLGDSVMFGWGVDEEQSYLGILDHELRRRQPVEVLNLAVPGYNTAMQVADFVDRGSAFEPDLVILHVVNNDLDPPRFLLDPRPVWGLDRLFLFDLFRGAADAGGRWIQPRDFETLDREERERLDERYGHLVGERAFKKALATLASISAKRGFEVVVVVPRCGREMWSMVCGAASDHGFAVIEIAPRLSRHLVEHGLPNDRDGWIEAFWLSRSDPHPSSLSHRIHAEAILEWIDESW